MFGWLKWVSAQKYELFHLFGFISFYPILFSLYWYVYVMVYLMFQWEEIVIEEFNSILHKLGMANWENVLKHVDFVEH